MLKFKAAILSLMLAASTALALPFDGAVPDTAQEAKMITPDTNKMLIMTTCGRIDLIALSVFEGPEPLQGKVILFPRDPASSDTENAERLTKIATDMQLVFLPAVAVIPSEELNNWQCA